jgi:hypothetical protein
MEFTATTFAAWWGAVTATLVLLWDIFKWSKGGAQIVVTALGDRKLFSSRRGPQDGYVILVTVKNRGKATTTFKGAFLKLIRGKTKKHKKSPEKTFYMVFETEQPIPHVLEPGQEWSGWLPQAQEFKEYSRDGFVEVEAVCSHQDKRFSALVEFSPERNSNDSD